MFDLDANPGRNVSETASSDLKSLTGASYYRPGEEGTTDRTVSNALSADMKALAEASVVKSGSPIAGWSFTPGVERSLTNFAFLLKNGKDAASLLTEKYDLAND